MQKVAQAVNSMKNNKSPGLDGIPAELLKYGGETLPSRMLELITVVWDEGSVLQQWGDTKLTSIYKRKGDCAVCGNSRWISLLSAVGKLLEKVMLTRLNKHNVDRVCRESKCGFRRKRGTINMLFVTRQQQEKCRE